MPGHGFCIFAYNFEMRCEEKYCRWKAPHLSICSSTFSSSLSSSWVRLQLHLQLVYGIGMYDSCIQSICRRAESEVHPFTFPRQQNGGQSGPAASVGCRMSDVGPSASVLCISRCILCCWRLRLSLSDWHSHSRFAWKIADSTGQGCEFVVILEI